MSHDEILHDYLDGKLSGSERGELEKRLATDDDLRAELEGLRSVIEAARNLPRSIEPGRDLWPDIEKRIRDEKIVRFPRRELFAVAAAILIFFAGIFTGIQKFAREAEQASSEPSAAELLDRLDREYAAASDDLFRLFDDRSEELDSVTVELIRRNLGIIDEAIRDIRVALDEDPDNRRLNRLLTGEYRRRSALLRQAADLADTI